MPSNSRSIMAKVSPPNQKLAEKLTILNNHVVGIMTRIYYIKKVSVYLNDLFLILRLFF